MKQSSAETHSKRVMLKFINFFLTVPECCFEHFLNVLPQKVHHK